MGDAYYSNQSAWSELNKDIDNVNTDPYKFEFDSGSMFDMLDSINTSTRKNLNRSAATARKDSVNATTQGMASRGITGGSVLDDTVNKLVNPINTGLFDSLSTLDDKTANAKLGVMNTSNQQGFAASEAGRKAEMLRLKLKGGTLSAEEQIRVNAELLQLEKDNQPNWWDDVLGVLGMVGDVAGGVGGVMSGINSFGGGKDDEKKGTEPD